MHDCVQEVRSVVKGLLTSGAHAEFKRHADSSTKPRLKSWPELKGKPYAIIGAASAEWPSQLERLNRRYWTPVRVNDHPLVQCTLDQSLSASRL